MKKIFSKRLILDNQLMGIVGGEAGGVGDEGDHSRNPNSTLNPHFCDDGGTIVVTGGGGCESVDFCEATLKCPR